MGLVISKGLTFRQQTQTLDADAQAYVNAVEVADGQRIEDPVRFAINDFVLGCKADGIWSAIKASCILAGARTLSGALVPLAGAAPTSFNFVDGDYNRKTGLVGDGVTKYLDSNRNNNADPQDSKHVSCYASAAATNIAVYIGAGIGAETGRSGVTWFSNSTNFRVNANASGAGTGASNTGFLGASRLNSESFNIRFAATSQSRSVTSETPRDESIGVFGLVRISDQIHANARLAFYSIGESLDLALLDARVTDLINAFAAAIP